MFSLYLYDDSKPCDAVESHFTAEVKTRKQLFDSLMNKLVKNTLQ